MCNTLGDMCTACEHSCGEPACIRGHNPADLRRRDSTDVDRRNFERSVRIVQQVGGRRWAMSTKWGGRSDVPSQRPVTHNLTPPVHVMTMGR